MTKSELTKKFAKHNGVPDSEAKIFFEVFLRKLAAHLNPGQSLGISGLGYFEMKKDEIKSAGSTADWDIICFSEYKGADDQLVFNIPDDVEQRSAVDSFFSLSFGKPIIPLEGVSDTEFFVPHSGIEYEKLFESKVEKLLVEAEGTEQSHYTELLIEREFQKPEKKEINWKSIPSGFDFESKKKIEDQIKPPSIEGEDSESISWDFGEESEHDVEGVNLELDDQEQVSLSDLEDKSVESASDEIKELKEQIGDYSKFEKDFNLKDEKTFSKDQIEEYDQHELEPYQPDLVEVDQPQIELNDQINLEEKMEERSESLETTGSSQSEETDESGEVEVPLSSIDDYEKVEPLINSSQSEESEVKLEEDISFNQDEENPERKYSEEDVIDEEGFTPVPPKVSSLLQMEDEEEGEKWKSSTSEPDNVGTDVPSGEDIYGQDAIKEAFDFAEKKRTRIESYSKHRKSGRIIAVIAALIVISGTIYLYTYYFGDRNSETNIIPPKVKDKSQAVIIERSYDYPVTYPYNKNTIVGLFEGINQDLLNSSLDNELTNNSAVETYEQRPSTRVKGYIYQYDGFFAVQVSSWKSLSIAKSEVLKYQNSGFDAFIEEARIKGDTYYRVRVGGFKTLEEAETFTTK